jgi:hypothetical protein
MADLMDFKVSPFFFFLPIFRLIFEEGFFGCTPD